MESSLYEEVAEDPHVFYSWNPTQEFLHQYFPTHRPYKKFKIDHQVQISPIAYDYPIHDEARRKVLSIVHYLGEDGDGTLLYDKDKNFVCEVEWKPNRALIFAAIDNVTWHAYKNTKGFKRKTIMTFFIRTGDLPN
jgi:hypothetical protein